MNKPSVLIAEKVHKIYPAPEEPLTVLKGVDFTLQAGETVFVVGRSGSGKSTLLHLLGGLDRATEGRIFFKGADLSLMNEKELTAYRGRKIGFIFQSFHLLPELDLFENVLLPSLMLRSPNRPRAKELIRQVGLDGREKHFPSELSGGEQQRAAIARALVNGPEILFCDEPTGNLDDETAQSVFQLLMTLQSRSGLSMVVVTHDEATASQYGAPYRLRDGVLSRDEIKFH